MGTIILVVNNLKYYLEIDGIPRKAPIKLEKVFSEKT